MYTMNEVLGWFQENGPWNVETRSYGENILPVVEPDAVLITAEYESGGYEGDAYVLFKSGNQYYEVHGSHCSCYGLEGMWSPEVTTEEALRHRVEKGSSYGAFNSCKGDIKAHFGWHDL